MSKKPMYVLYGGEFLVFVNPSSDQISNLLRKTKFGSLKGHLGLKLLVWNGDGTNHDHIDDTGDFGKLRSYIKKIMLISTPTEEKAAPFAKIQKQEKISKMS